MAEKPVRVVTPKRQPTDGERLLIAKKTGGRCHVCGDVLHPHWEADHVVPFKRGGSSKLSNLLPICKECNILRKAHRPATIRKIIRLGTYARAESKKDTELGRLILELLVSKHRESKKKFVDLKARLRRVAVRHSDPDLER